MMTKLVMITVLVCLFVPLGVHAQGEDNNRGAVAGPNQEDFEKDYFNKQVTQLYAPTPVCTKADLPRPGSRFAYGRCFDNFRKSVPLDNPPAWDCEHEHGVGNCILVKMPNPAPEVTWYVPKCEQGWGLFIITTPSVVDPTKDTKVESTLFCGLKMTPGQKMWHFENHAIVP